MMGFGYGLAGFANGLSSGIDTGAKLHDLIQQDQLAKVREQGIAEARAAQDAATPKVTDLGDQDNLTANPQQSTDPNYTPPPINTSLTAALQGAQDQQAAQSSPDQNAQANGIKTYAVDQPAATKIDPNTLSDVPQASTIPGSKPIDTNDPDSNLDAAAQSGKAPLTPSKRFNVDGQGFDTQEEAAAYVKKQTPQLESFFHDTLVPKMTATLVAQGKIDQAQAWEKYADEEQTRQNMATWGKAIKLSQFGDYDSAATELMKLHPHFADGYDLVSATPTQGPDGSSGFTMKVKGPDGQVQEMYQDSKTLTQLGLSQLSPIEMFNQKFKQQTNADIMQAKAGYDQQNDERTMKRSLAVAGVRADTMQKVTDTRTQAQKDIAEGKNKTVTAVHSADQAAKDLRQQKALEAKAKHDADLIKAKGQYRMAVSPQERRAIIVTHLSSDPMFNMKTPQEQNDQIARTLKQVYGDAGPATQPATPAQQGISMPAPGAAPQQSAPQAPPGKIGVPVFDPTSGQMRTVFR